MGDRAGVRAAVSADTTGSGRSAPESNAAEWESQASSTRHQGAVSGERVGVHVGNCTQMRQKNNQVRWTDATERTTVL